MSRFLIKKVAVAPGQGREAVLLTQFLGACICGLLEGGRCIGQLVGPDRDVVGTLIADLGTL